MAAGPYIFDTDAQSSSGFTLPLDATIARSRVQTGEVSQGLAHLIAALFVESDGCYFGLPGVDPWDISRDARTYAGPHPVVAHPPCDRWHMLSAVNNKRWGYRINEDDGCFAAALAAVRKWGGVLEHPAQSRAFRFHGIPQPTSRGWQRTLDGDWITEVDQAAYGHRARKSTWLLYHGDTPPPMLDWRNVRGTHQVGHFDKNLPVMGQKEALATPIAFRDLLLSIARSAHSPRHLIQDTRDGLSDMDALAAPVLETLLHDPTHSAGTQRDHD